MSITRRTGLGAIIGGMFGAPQAASAVQEKMSEVWAKQSIMKMGSTKDPGIGYPTDAIPQTADPVELEAKRLEHIQQLTKSARGELNEYEKEELDRCNKVYNHKIPLKSVSKSYKVLMRKDIEIKRQKNEWKDDAVKRLFRHYGIKL